MGVSENRGGGVLIVRILLFRGTLFWGPYSKDPTI